MLGSKKKKDINEIDTQSECHTSEANKYSTQSGTTGVLGTSAAGICMECKHIFLPFLTATYKSRDHSSSSRRVWCHCVLISSGHCRNNARKPRVILKKHRSWRGMRNSRPSGTSVMLFRLSTVNTSRVATAPCFISSNFRLGMSLRERCFSLGNHPVRNAIFSPLYALRKCRTVKFANRERDGKGSSLSCDQDRRSEYKFCSIA